MLKYLLNVYYFISKFMKGAIEIKVLIKKIPEQYIRNDEGMVYITVEKVL